MLDSLYVDDFQLHHVPNQIGLRAASGFGSPVPRDNRTPRAQQHGLIDRTQFYAGRIFTLEGYVRGDDSEGAWELLDSLKAKLALGSTHTMRFRRSGRSEDEQVSVTVSSELEAPLNVSGRMFRWGVTLTAADPRMYGANLKSGSYDPTTSISGGGVTFPLTFPLVFTTTTSTHLVVTNDGQFASPPIFTIRGPITNPIIDNDSLGVSIDLTLGTGDVTLGANDTITVDVATRSVKLNGTSRPDLLDATLTTWFELQPGTNNLRLRGSGMTAGQSQLTVQYRDARI